MVSHEGQVTLCWSVALGGRPLCLPKLTVEQSCSEGRQWVGKRPSPCESEGQYMDSSSFASTLFFGDEVTTAHVYPVSVSWLSPRDPDGQFARQLPIALSCLYALSPSRVLPAPVRPVRHRSECFAIVGGRSSCHFTSVVGFPFGSLSSSPAPVDNRCPVESSPRQFGPSYWPRPPRPHSDGFA